MLRPVSLDDHSKEHPRKRVKENAKVRLSKAMSKVLRHSPPPSMDASGWVPVADLISTLKQNVDMFSIQSVVEEDAKGRFELDVGHSPPRIRATQGHSVKLATPSLVRVTSASQVKAAIHVTSKKTWEDIQLDGFLRRMKRTHIHFATSSQLARKNAWASCFLRLNVLEALSDGVPLFVSSNGVVLCEGPLPIKYVEVVDEAEAFADASQDVTADM